MVKIKLRFLSKIKKEIKKIKVNTEVLSHLILYQWTKFQCHTFFPSQDIKPNVLLKLVSNIFYQKFIFSQNNSPLKTMKNIFYFILKALFILEIFRFL